MNVDNDKLISAVCENAPLWNVKDKRYHSRDVQRKLWAKVAEEMGADNNVADVKKKWKGLRDMFRREYKRIHKSGDEAPTELSSSWPFFSQMMFLSDIMDPRDFAGNVTFPLKASSPVPINKDFSQGGEDSLPSSVALKDDSDYLFLLSLLPYMKEVAHHRKLSVRNKLQQVFIDEDELRHTSMNMQSSYAYTRSPSS